MSVLGDLKMYEALALEAGGATHRGSGLHSHLFCPKTSDYGGVMGRFLPRGAGAMASTARNSNYCFFLRD